MSQTFSPNELENFIRFFENLFAHTLTLEELLRMVQSGQVVDDCTYGTLKAKYDTHAAQQFDIFYSDLRDPAALSKAMRDFLALQPKTGKLQ